MYMLDQGFSLKFTLVAPYYQITNVKYERAIAHRSVSWGSRIPKPQDIPAEVVIVHSETVFF